MKRVLDLVLALIGSALLSPVFILVIWLCYRNFGTPIFFTQIRPGLNGRPFQMIKFRTMTNQTDIQGNLLPDARRITPFGQWLRSSSLDELPELWNVIMGHMSLVGPRPLLMDYLPLYTPEQRRRHEVRPGITGWAQVNGRNSISWEEKFELDVWYVDNQSLWLDLKILWLTFWRVLSREGISARGDASMPRFTGVAQHEVRRQ